MVCDNLEGWDVGDGRKKGSKRRGYIYIYMGYICGIYMGYTYKYTYVIYVLIYRIYIHTYS